MGYKVIGSGYYFRQTISVLLLILGLPFMIHATSGDLDPAFSSDGKVTLAYGMQTSKGWAIAIQPDGKIVVAGQWGTNVDFIVIRYNSDGSLDTSFNLDGAVTTDIGGGTDIATDVTVLADGKIIVVGSAQMPGSFDFAIVRYNSNGSLDSNFSADGKLTIDFLGDTDIAWSVAIQPDGKIVAAGSAGTGIAQNFAVVRYNPDGSPDSSFHLDGKLLTDFSGSNDGAYGVAIEPGGKIIAAGTANAGTSYEFALARYTPNGALDDNFDADGKVITVFGANDDVARTVKLQPDGKIIAAGSYTSNTGTDFALARYNPDGSLDPTFSSDGKVVTDFDATNDVVEDLLLQPDGKIVAAGGDFSNFALARYNAGGTLDATFSFDGKVTTDFFGSSDKALAIAQQSDGKIVAAGFAYSGAIHEVAVARYFSDTVALCLFCDDFENSVLATNWDYEKPSWSESGGNLIGIPASRKAQAIATPAFGGCSSCSVLTGMATAGGAFNKLFFYAWYVDKKNTVVVLMKQENNKFVMKQLVGGVTVGKTKGLATILPNVFYNVEVTFDGVNFTLIVDGNTLATMPAAVAPNGTVGFAVKNTTGSFGYITVN